MAPLASCHSGHTLALAGSTPLGMYRNLVKYCEEDQISFKYVKTFNMDEYVGIPRDHPESYHYFMYENFFKHIDIDPSTTAAHMQHRPQS